MMTTEGLVSVIVPAYNHERYVVGALGSVLRQGYAAIELIIIDDHSRDGTARVCERFVTSAAARARFQRLVFIRHERNLGAHAALNEGIAAARGQFISFLNSDDCFDPDRIERCVEACVEDDSFVFTGVQAINEAGESVDDDVVGAIRNVLASRRTASPSLSFAFMGNQLTVSTGNMFVTRDLLLSVGPFAPLRYCHDWDMALRLIGLVEPIYVPADLYLYRQHATNSYLDLQTVAEAETEQVLRGYFRRVKLGRVTNAQAPTPLHWPGVFEVAARRHGVYRFWQMESGAYPKVCRVIDEAAYLPRLDD